MVYGMNLIPLSYFKNMKPIFAKPAVTPTMTDAQREELYAYIGAGNVPRVLASLQEWGFSVNDPIDDEERTPLLTASYNGPAELVTALLTAGAEVNLPANNGATPLLIASQNGHIEIVAALLDAGANVNLPENNGATPLIIASEKGHAEIVAALLDAGADVNLARNDGATILSLVINHTPEEQKIPILLRLIAHGATATPQEISYIKSLDRGKLLEALQDKTLITPELTNSKYFQVLLGGREINFPLIYMAAISGETKTLCSLVQKIDNINDIRDPSGKLDIIDLEAAACEFEEGENYKLLTNLIACGAKLVTTESGVTTGLIKESNIPKDPQGLFLCLLGAVVRDNFNADRKKQIFDSILDGSKSDLLEEWKKEFPVGTINEANVAGLIQTSLSEATANVQDAAKLLSDKISVILTTISQEVEEEETVLTPAMGGDGGGPSSSIEARHAEPAFNSKKRRRE